jgi:phage repressor protein C with HTH and peptisase S24 domain
LLSVEKIVWKQNLEIGKQLEVRYDPSMRNTFQEHELFRAALTAIVDEQGHGVQKGIAAAVERSPSYINDILRGRAKGSANTRRRIAEALGLGYEAMLERGASLLRQPSEPASITCHETEFMTVPMVRARLSGGGGSFETEGEIVGYYAFRTDFLRRKGSASSMVLFQVAGHSMSPVLNNGDTVMVDQSQNDVLPGHIYAVGIDDTVVVKRIEIEPGALILKCENPEYGKVEIVLHEHANVRIIGRVVWSAREY